MDEDETNEGDGSALLFPNNGWILHSIAVKDEDCPVLVVLRSFIGIRRRNIDLILVADSNKKKPQEVVELPSPCSFDDKCIMMWYVC